MHALFTAIILWVEASLAAIFFFVVDLLLSEGVKLILGLGG